MKWIEAQSGTLVNAANIAYIYTAKEGDEHVLYARFLRSAAEDVELARGTRTQIVGLLGRIKGPVSSGLYE